MDMSTVLGNISFSVFDYTVIGISLGVALFCGLYHVAFTSHSAEDYLVGGRAMTTTPVAISTAMLYISALAIIGSPAEIYYNGIESFMASVVTAAVVPFSAFLFVPMFHKMELTSIHQYIGHRFDSTVLRCITSLTFLLQQGFLICVMLILVSNALKLYFEIPVLTSIIGIGVFTAVNTTLGGFKATVWMQVLHFICISGFLALLAAIGFTKAGGFVNSFELAAEQGRLELFNFKLDPFMKHNFYNFIFGYGFMTLMEMATCQPIVQRYSSLITRRDALKSVFMGIPLHIVPSFLCLLIGIFLNATYNEKDPLTRGEIDSPQSIIPYFIKTKVFIPGITGAFIACIGGGMISVFSTSLNSMTACTYQDFIAKLGCCCEFSDSEERGQAVCCRVINFIYATLCIVLTCVAVYFPYSENAQIFSDMENLLTFNAIMYGPLAAVFLMAMFFPCINKYGATIGFVTGVGAMGYIAVNKLFVTPFIPWHPKAASEELESMSFTINNVFSISYLLLTPLGAIITIIISFPISIVTGGLCVCAARKIPASHLHPMLSFSDCCIDSEERTLQHGISYKYVDRIASVHNLFPGSVARLDPNPPSYRYSSIPSNSPSVWS
ncbi:unnamed protein product [Orchesella dallaii]|uniref:Sodium-coupled monocarboxylate transporter 1 n=1 Tax=Orchesella dallaii TaxID=48710 RepID=A0ABP1Q4X4_9HEXA